MAMWKKALVLVVASLVVVLPVVTQVVMVRPLILGVFPTRQAAEQALGTSSTASQSSVVLPQGKKLSNAQLQKADGKGVITGLIGVAIGAGLAYGAELYDHRKPNPIEIANSAAAWGLALGTFVPDPLIKSAVVSAARWTARAAAAGALRIASSSVGSKIANGFNRYIGGPVSRFFHGKW